MIHADRSVRFGTFGFDPDTGDVTREGAPVTRLQEQPSRVLAALTSQAGQLVTRDDLCRLLWPENSLVDADNGLNIAINKIRHALDDSAAQPRFIQTVPRRGYRFIANIERPPALTTPAAGSNVEPGADHVQSPTLSQPVQSVRRVRMFGFATAGLLIVVFVVASTWSIAPRSAAIRSAAVMPFVNLAGDRGLDYVVQGLTDTLATELAARGVPRVISPEATAHFKNSSASPGQMARELHADALVFGTVVRDGASFAVNVRLVNGQTERQLWVKRFVRASPIELTFSEDVLSGLAPALGLASVTAAPEAGRAPITAAARDEYLRGRYFWNMRTADGMDAAVEHLTRAVDIERHYALAWAGLADVYAAGGDAPSTALVPWSGAREAGLRAADEALRLNPSLGEAHAALGKLRMAQWRWGDAERELAEAVRLSPNYATARQWYGTLLMRLQKCPGAVEQTAIGGEIDPITPIVNEAVGVALAVCGQPERAILAYRKVLSLHPDFATTHMRLAGAYLRFGNAPAAVAEYREAERLRPNNCEFQARMAGALEAAGQLSEARAVAARVVADARRGRATLFCVAIADANMGDIDRAIAALDATITAHGPVEGLLADFHLRTLHSDPRWSGLVDRVGLTPYAQATAAKTLAPTRGK